jgi:hypothetical protein
MNLALWANNNESTVYTPNSVTTQTALQAGNLIPTVVPLFINTYLGPNGTANTMITDIDSGFKITQQVHLRLFSYPAKHTLYTNPQ